MQKPPKDYDVLFKVITVGDSGVGKTSLLLRFTEDQFTDHVASSIGVDFKFKNVKIKGKTVKVQVWDSGGQERFRAVTSSFYHGAHGALLVYDIASKVLPSQKISFNHAFPKKETFKSAKGWLTEIQRYATGEMVTIMVGNKQDLKAKREVPAEKGEKFAKKKGMGFMETSAKETVNVEECFTSLVSTILDQLQVEESKNPKINLSKPAKQPPSSKKRCTLG